MAYTQTQIDQLKAAIASGVLTVKHGDTLTTYRSLAEMKEALRDMEGEVNRSNPPRRTVAGFSRGL
jgi:enamine deaminase RidA (YjgF/YER057c/UK114 family)